MPAIPYDALLCDVDGVLRHWPNAGELERVNGLPVGAVAASAFAPERLEPAITGAVTDEEWRASVAADLAETFGSVARADAAVAAWSALVPRVDLDVIGLLADVRPAATIVLVTNATTRLEADLADQGLDRVADLVINSARVGVAKPDPRIFHIAAERAGASLDRCLMIDDTQVNVVAARSIGMAARQYRTIDDLRSALRLATAGRAGRAPVSACPGARAALSSRTDAAAVTRTCGKGSLPHLGRAPQDGQRVIDGLARRTYGPDS